MAAPKARIATVKGVWIRPGVSKNRRLYTKAHIASAVAEAQQHLAAGGELTVLTHHSAAHPVEGDVTRTAGQITKVDLDADGNGTFEADIADTDAGRDIAALTTPEKPYLRGVSMRSMWKGTPRTVETAEGSAECADGFTLRGVDFTHSPGVTGAGITSAELAEGAATAVLICEEIEEAVFVDAPAGNEPTPASPAEPVEGGDAPGNGALPYGKVTYADPGYQADKKKRYPLDTAAHVRAANSYIGVKKNADKYTSAQLKRIKARIASAAKKFGIDLTADESFIGDVTEIVEAYASMSLDNGPATVRVSTWVNEPEKLAAVGRRIAIAALAGLHALDPDNDGDVDTDTDTAGDDTDDDSPCAFCSFDIPSGAAFCPACGQAIPAESAPTKGDTVGETTPNAGSATESAPARNLTDADIAALAAAMKSAPAEAAPTAATTESTTPAPPTPAPAAAPVEAAPVPAAALTAEQVQAMIAESNKAAAEAAVEAFRAEYVQDLRSTGPRRIGRIAESESVEDIYGAAEPDLSKASMQDLEKLAEHAVGPLISRGLALIPSVPAHP